MFLLWCVFICWLVKEFYCVDWFFGLEFVLFDLEVVEVEVLEIVVGFVGVFECC